MKRYTDEQRADAAQRRREYLAEWARKQRAAKRAAKQPKSQTTKPPQKKRIRQRWNTHDYHCPVCGVEISVKRDCNCPHSA